MTHIYSKNVHIKLCLQQNSAYQVMPSFDNQQNEKKTITIIIKQDASAEDYSL